MSAVGSQASPQQLLYGNLRNSLCSMTSAAECFIRSYLHSHFEQNLAPYDHACLRAQSLHNRCEDVCERARQWHVRQRRHGFLELDDTCRYFDSVRFDSVLHRHRCKARKAFSDLLPLITTGRFAARTADLPCWRRAMQTYRIPRPREFEMNQRLSPPILVIE